WRGDPPNPRLLDDYKDLIKDVRTLKEGSSYDYLFLDTPPMVDDKDVVEASVVLADAVVPTKASIFGVESLRPLLEMCQERRKPLGFLMSDVDERFKSLNSEMLGELIKEAREFDGRVFATRISHRFQYINALTTGQS